MKSRLHRLLWPGVMAAVMLMVLLGLGTWQVQRLRWKLDVLAQIARAEAAPAVSLPTEPDPFAKVEVTGHLRNDLVAFGELGHARGGDGGHPAHRRRQGAVGDDALHGGASGATGAAVRL